MRKARSPFTNVSALLFVMDLGVTRSRWILQNFFEVIKTDAYLALDKELLREINYNASSQYSPVSKKRKAIDLDADDNNGAQD